jgi:acetyl esterase/lipase
MSTMYFRRRTSAGAEGGPALAAPRVHQGGPARQVVSSGDDDRNVPFSQSVDRVQRLRERGVKVEELVLPGEVHDIPVHAHKLRTFGATADFLERKLKGP